MPSSVGSEASASGLLHRQRYPADRLHRMRVLMLAPFERGVGQGGSQRATAIAERLEERGIEVGWRRVPRRETGRAAKVGALLRGRPGVLGLYEALSPPPWGDTEWDALIVAHSYLVPAVSALAATRPMVVDFHNLEWQSMRDALRGPALSTRRAYDTVQVALLRRAEREI